MHQDRSWTVGVAIPAWSTSIIQVGKLSNELDAERHNTHEGLILSVKLLNSICRMVGLEPIFRGNVEERVEIGDFAIQVVSELFQTRKL